jgi:acyl carrier protein
MKNKIKTLIIDSIKEFNLTADDKIETEKIYGDGSPLDSMGLVNLIVLLENNIEDVFSKSISLTSEKALSQKRSPFQNIETLSNFVETLLNETVNE